MSELHEKKTELVVLHSIPPHQGLMKVNRWLMATVFFLMAVIVIVGFFLLPANDLSRYKKAEVADMNPVLSDQLPDERAVISVARLVAAAKSNARPVRTVRKRVVFIDWF